MNRQLIGQDQEEYQRELERNFVQIKLQMEPFLKPPKSYQDLITAWPIHNFYQHLNILIL